MPSCRWLDVWTGDPLGVRWDLPTAAVQNAAGDFVVPSAAAAKAAEADATFASTTDPTTNNLVTFNATRPCHRRQARAYNNCLMLESYLVVPTNGLPADKALALAQFIRFAVGGTGQADITSLGAAGATPAMVSADLTVAQQLDAEAATASSSTVDDHHHDHQHDRHRPRRTPAASASGTGTSSRAVPSPLRRATPGRRRAALAVTGGDPRAPARAGLRPPASAVKLARRLVATAKGQSMTAPGPHPGKTALR